MSRIITAVLGLSAAVLLDRVFAEWSLRKTACARAVELQRRLDSARSLVAAARTEAAMREEHLRDQLDGANVALRTAMRDTETAQQMAKRALEFAGSKYDALADELRQRREQADAPRRLSNLMNGIAEHVATVSDEDLLADAAAEGLDVGANAERVRSVLLRAVSLLQRHARQACEGQPTTATEPTPWSTMRHIATVELEWTEALKQLAEQRGEGASEKSAHIVVYRLATALLEAADRGQHAVETAGALVAAVDAVLEWRGGACRSPSVMREALERLGHARAALDAPAMPATRREAPDDDLVTVRYGVKLCRSEAIKQYHAERIAAAEEGWSTIAETPCPLCGKYDGWCFPDDDATVGHG